MSLAEELTFVANLARGAGKLILEQHGKVERLTKTHVATTAEAVTEADRASQRLIVKGLRERFPDDGLVGEESDTGTSITFECTHPMGRNWVIDPIDGTNNFIAGFGAFAVCIGLLDKGVPVLGVVYDVTRDTLYAAAKGEGAWRNDERIHATPLPMSDSALLMITSNLIDKNDRCPAWVGRWMAQTNWKIRILGSAALEAVHVASGVTAGAVTVNGKLWDVAAPAAIVLEAGGTITDLTGQPIFPYDLRDYVGAKVPFLAAGAKAHATLIREIIDHP